MSVCFVESLFTPIEGWPLLPTTCHWRMSYPSASTLLSWRVSCFHTLHLFANRLQSRPSDYLKITNVSYDMMVISLKHPDKSFSCCAFSSFLTRGTCGCGWVTLRSHRCSISICHISAPPHETGNMWVFSLLCFSFRWWYQSESKLPGRGVGAQTSFRISHAALPRRGQQGVEWWVSPQRHTRVIKVCFYWGSSQPLKKSLKPTIRRG